MPMPTADTLTSDSSYPRDLRGHGRQPPHAQWPGQARIALQFVLNVEEGSENNPLHSDGEKSETFLSEIMGAEAFDNRHMSMESMYEYGSRAGVWRILREFDQRGLPLTVFAVAAALQRYPELVQTFMSRGDEIASHGLRWIHHQHMAPDAEAAQIAEATRVLHELTAGEWPLGWYTGRDSPQTRRLVAEHGGFAYDSDYYGDDLPFWLRVRKADGSDSATPGAAVRAGHQRHAFPADAGLQHRRPLLPVPARRLRRAVRRGRPGGPGPAEDDEHRHALPRAGQAGAHCRFAALSGPCAGQTGRVDLPPHRHCAALADQAHPFYPPRLPKRLALRSGTAMLTLQQLNDADQAAFTALLAGTYEHSPWVAELAWAHRPPGGFVSLAALKHALATAVRGAGRERQLVLIRAHPELAGKAMVSQSLTAESTNEQGKAGLTDCTSAEFARIQQLNADYNAKFGWPFILAVRGPRGLGLDRDAIIATFERRLAGHPDVEFAEALRNIHRIAEIRLNDSFGAVPRAGQQVWDWAEALALHSDPGFKEAGQLTVTYLTAAHQACAAQLEQWMQQAGFDDVRIDAVGNVVGVYHGVCHGASHDASHGPDPAAPRLLTGSHYDTVRNGGKYDGRLGILAPLAAVQSLHAAGRRLPFGIELAAFAEEEGQRYKATFLGSSALTGDFDPAWLDQHDADGTSVRSAMQAAGLPGTLDAIQAEQRDPQRYLGFVEIHIEQGPVLNALDLPLGVVTSINGSLRFAGSVTGTASHAGTTPMGASRRDAACAVAEFALFVEQRAAAVPDAVGTVGMLHVLQGSINVVPGRCDFSLDLRATTNAARDALGADVTAELARICQRRGVAFTLERTLAASAAPSAPAWRQRWERAVAALGLPVHRMPSGAGHDAMKLHEVMPQAMLFVRGGNDGISHNPLETITADDADLCVAAFMNLLEGLASE